MSFIFLEQLGNGGPIVFYDFKLVIESVIQIQQEIPWSTIQNNNTGHITNNTYLGA